MKKSIKSYTIYKLGLIILGIIGALCSAGVIFGFQALLPLLLEQGIYKELCNPQNACKEQVLQLNWMFSIATTCTNMASLPIGLFLDAFGSRWSIGCGALLFTTGCLLFGFSSSILPLYTLGYILIAIGGPFIYIGSLNLSMAFPNHSGLIMAALTGAFDASSFIFLGFQYISHMNHEWADVHFLFRVYAFIPALICLCLVVLLPNKPYKLDKSLNQDEEDESSPLLEASLVQKTLFDQLCSREFIGLTFVLCIFMVKLNFYISTMSHQLYEMKDSSNLMTDLVHVFNFLLPLGGIVSIPFIGYILDTYSFTVNFGILSVLGLLFSMTSMIYELHVQYVSILLFVFMRPLIYSLSGDFCCKMFELNDFGRIYGVMNLMGGIFNLSQYALSFIAIDVMGKHFYVSNGILLLFTLFTFGFPIYLHSMGSRMQHEKRLLD